MGQPTAKSDTEQVSAEPQEPQSALSEPLPPAPAAPEEKTDFLGRLKDDANTPLVNIVVRAERLMKRATALNQQELLSDIQEIKDAARRLATLIKTSKRSASAEGALETALLEAATAAGQAKPAVSAPEDTKRRRRGNEYVCVLIVDSNKTFRQLMGLLLERHGYDVSFAETGEVGLWLAQNKRPDVILLELELPGMTGYDILRQLKSDISLRKTPVIIISRLDQDEHAVKCIELGAEDFLNKSFNPRFLQARIEACLEKKRLFDTEQGYLDKLQAEQEKSERLLLNVLPRAIADRLKKGESMIVDRFPEASVLFGDLVGFTALSTELEPEDLVQLLNEVFSAFDRLAEMHGLEKIKTIGDAYMVAGGLPTPRPDHAEAVAEMALDMQNEINKVNARHGTNLNIRVGMDSGPVIGGIIGRNRFIYDLWGDTVNTASRMEAYGYPSCIHVTASTYRRLREKYLFEERGPIEVKGKGQMITYFLMGRAFRT